MLLLARSIFLEMKSSHGHGTDRDNLATIQALSQVPPAAVMSFLASRKRLVNSVTVMFLVSMTIFSILSRAQMRRRALFGSY